MNKEIELIKTKLKMCIDDDCNYICDKEHSKILLDYITNLEQKVNKIMSTLKEEVSYLMPYEIYHDEVDNIVEKVEKIVNDGD